MNSNIREAYRMFFRGERWFRINRYRMWANYRNSTFNGNFWDFVLYQLKIDKDRWNRYLDSFKDDVEYLKEREKQ